jgi:hypothetical protein
VLGRARWLRRAPSSCPARSGSKLFGARERSEAARAGRAGAVDGRLVSSSSSWSPSQPASPRANSPPYHSQPCRSTSSSPSRPTMPTTHVLSLAQSSCLLDLMAADRRPSALLLSRNRSGTSSGRRPCMSWSTVARSAPSSRGGRCPCRKRCAGTRSTIRMESASPPLAFCWQMSSATVREALGEGARSSGGSTSLPLSPTEQGSSCPNRLHAGLVVRAAAADQVSLLLSPSPSSAPSCGYHPRP